MTTSPMSVFETGGLAKCPSFPNVKLDNRKNYFYGRCQNTSLLNDMGIIVAEKKMDDGPNLYIIEKKQ